MHLDPSPQQFSKKVTPRKCIISIFASAAIHPIDIKGILSIDHAISGISNVLYAIELNKKGFRHLDFFAIVPFFVSTKAIRTERQLACQKTPSSRA